MKIAINGFGAIGRILLRQISERNASMEVVAVCDASNPESLVNLLNRDTVYGRLSERATLESNSIRLGERSIALISDFEDVRWDDLDVDLVIETGTLLRRTGPNSFERHLEAGAPRVLITGMALQPDLFWVAGVNDDHLQAEFQCVSLGGRVLHSLAPICKVLDEQFGLETANVTAMLPMSQDQRLQDGAHRFAPYGRAAALNYVVSPVSTDWNLGRVYPILQGKVTGLNYRSPVVGGGIIQLTAVTRNRVVPAEVNHHMQNASKERMRGLIATTEDSLVSSDCIGTPQSCVFDLNLTYCAGERQIRVAWWFDPTWSLVARAIDFIEQAT